LGGHLPPSEDPPISTFTIYVILATHQQRLGVDGRVARVVRPTSRLHVVKYEPDNRIIECALHAPADIIVTGDRHLLTLKKYQSVQVIRLADFLKLVGEIATPNE
jgi:predicted nucleic acid-binding protein